MEAFLTTVGLPKVGGEGVEAQRIQRLQDFLGLFYFDH
jgi:hypothetical protein